MNHPLVTFCEATDGFDLRMQVTDVLPTSTDKYIMFTLRGISTVMYDGHSVIGRPSITIEDNDPFIVCISGNSYRGKIILNLPLVIGTSTMLDVSKKILAKFDALNADKKSKFDLTIVEQDTFLGVRGWKVNADYSIVLDNSSKTFTVCVIDVVSNYFGRFNVGAGASVRVGKGRFIWFVDSSGNIADNPVVRVTL